MKYRVLSPCPHTIPSLPHYQLPHHSGTHSLRMNLHRHVITQSPQLTLGSPLVLYILRFGQISNGMNSSLECQWVHCPKL